MMSAPFVAEALVGEKTTLKLMFFPGAMTAGVITEERANPVPETRSWSRLKESTPLLVIVRACEFF